MWLKCEIKRKTDKATLISVNGEEMWLPNSLIYNKRTGFLDIIDWKYSQILNKMADKLEDKSK